MPLCSVFRHPPQAGWHDAVVLPQIYVLLAGSMFNLAAMSVILCHRTRTWQGLFHVLDSLQDTEPSGVPCTDQSFA